MGVSRSFWNDAYQGGVHQSQWDYDYPSQELIGALSILNLPNGSTALDLGCGGGRDAIFLAQMGLSTSGVDLSSVAVEIASARAREASVDVSFCEGDVLDLPFSDAAFSLVTDRACFHHIRDEDRPIYVREVCRVLKSGGHLLIRGSSRRRDDSYYEVDEASIRKFFPDSDFVIGAVLPIRLMNNAGGLTANMVTLRKR
jgi:ubiquinone/menaquinone biosynthesis C-methylase UbiE